MRVLVLSWDARAGDGGLAPQARGLAAALAGAGHTVRLVTRLAGGGSPPCIPGVEVHAVGDAPPIVPAALDEPMLAALAFASRATSVAVRRLEESPVDVVHAEGWQTGPVVAALRRTHDVPVVAAPGGAGRIGDPAAADIAAQLVADADRVLARSAAERMAVAADGADVVQLRPGVDVPDRPPGPPPGSGALLLVAPPDHDHRGFARDLRDGVEVPRRISRSWRRRPFAVAVLDPSDLDGAVRGLAAGVPLLAVEGAVGDLVRGSGAGVVVEPSAAAVAHELDRLVRQPARAAALGAAATAAAADLAWPGVAATWHELVAPVIGARGVGRLHATG